MRFSIGIRTGVLLLAAVIALPVSAGVLTGTVKDDKGSLMEGVLVRVTDDAMGISESAYTCWRPS